MYNGHPDEIQHTLTTATTAKNLNYGRYGLLVCTIWFWLTQEFLCLMMDFSMSGNLEAKTIHWLKSGNEDVLLSSSHTLIG